MGYCKKDSENGMVNMFHNKNYHPIDYDDLVLLEDRSYVNIYIQVITTILETDSSTPIFHISNEDGITNLFIESDTYLGIIAAKIRSTKELASSYAHNSKSLSKEELDRLKRDGGGIERDYLLLHLSPSDPVVKAITTRLTVQLANGYSIVL